jgi:lipopolysaccharide/colanic/teichoic acid biosynthesis glycosyltransferase
MWLRKFADLPSEMQNETVLRFYNQLAQKKGQLAFKRLTDLAGASALLVLASPLMLLIAAAVALTTPGGALFSQQRIMRYGQPFRIYKFRTMYKDSQHGGLITRAGDGRITPVGKLLRRTRLDELPQLYNVLRGELSLIGPRPEVPSYVALYDDAMLATLLLPAGIASDACIRFCDEAVMLTGPDFESVYREEVLPAKMRMNVRYLENFSILEDLSVFLRLTALPFAGRKDNCQEAILRNKAAY